MPKLNIPYQPLKGKAFLLPSATFTDPNGHHLYIICTNPCGEAHNLLATISTWRNDLCDPTCILEPGCHDFVVKKSYVRYQMSRIEPSAAIQEGIKSGEFIKRPDFSPGTMAEICDGFEVSQQTPAGILKYYLANKDN